MVMVVVPTVSSDSSTESKRPLVFAFACALVVALFADAEASVAVGIWQVLESNSSVVGVSRSETGLSIVGVVNLNQCTAFVVIFRGGIVLLACKWKN